MTEEKTKETVYTWGDSFWYMLGYEDGDVVVDKKHLSQRHILHKQIKHNSNFKLNKVSINEEAQSVVFETEVKMGKMSTKKEIDNPKPSYSDVVARAYSK